MAALQPLAGTFKCKPPTSEPSQFFLATLDSYTLFFCLSTLVEVVFEKQPSRPTLVEDGAFKRGTTQLRFVHGKDFRETSFTDSGEGLSFEPNWPVYDPTPDTCASEEPHLDVIKDLVEETLVKGASDINKLQVECMVANKKGMKACGEASKKSHGESSSGCQVPEKLEFG